MKRFSIIFTALCAGGLVCLPAIADDNIAACEIVVMRPIKAPAFDVTEPVLTTDTPMVARFLPAGEFIFSVFDETSETITQVDGQKIRGIMCIRSNVMPTEFDLKMIRTGIPLHLSQNFDSPDSALLSIRKQGGVYVHTYSGADLSEGDKEVLKLRLEKLNQPARQDIVENVENVEEVVGENADH